MSAHRLGIKLEGGIGRDVMGHSTQSSSYAHRTLARLASCVMAFSASSVCATISASSSPLFTSASRPRDILERAWRGEARQGGARQGEISVNIENKAEVR